MSLVLLIDDDPSVIRASKRALRREPYDIIDLDGSTPVIEAVGDRQPAVAVIDWHLHGNTSRDLVESVTLAYPTCVSIVFSGDARPEERRNARTAGAWLWLNKLEAASLASFVNQALVEHQYRRSEEGMTLDEYNGRFVAERLKRFDGKLAPAARSLGISRSKARRILRDWQNAA